MTDLAFLIDAILHAFAQYRRLVHKICYPGANRKNIFFFYRKRESHLLINSNSIESSNKMHKLTERKISEILLIKVSLPVVVLLGALVLTPFNAWADEDSDSPHQFGELSDDTGVVQEENVQGRTITGSIETQVANTIFGTDEADTILGSPTDDRIEAKDGDDLVMGNEGNDRMFGSSGDDLLQGNLGNDKIDGEGRNDVIIGGDFDDILSGGDGDDSLFGGPGNDILKGGEGKNRFVCADGVDTVLDYEPSKGDTVSGDCEVVHRI